MSYVITDKDIVLIIKYLSVEGEKDIIWNQHYTNFQSLCNPKRLVSNFIACYFPEVQTGLLFLGLAGLRQAVDPYSLPMPRHTFSSVWPACLSFLSACLACLSWPVQFFSCLYYDTIWMKIEDCLDKKTKKSCK